MSSPGLAPPATPADPATPPPPPAPSWYAAHNDNEFTGTLQNRGLDKKEATDAAYDFYKAHREATQMISRLTGTPDKDRILIQPKPESTEAEKQAFWEKLGRPAKADDYDFKGIKFPDGSELDEGFTAFLRSAAFKTNMSKDAAEAFARDTVAYLQKGDEAEAAETAMQTRADAEALKKSWGPNYEANEFVANQGFKKLADAANMTPEQAAAALKALGGVAGRGNVAQFLLAAGKAFGEHRYVQNQMPNNPDGIMTREQAKAKLADLRMDHDWVKRFNTGDSRAKNEFEALTAMMVGDV